MGVTAAPITVAEFLEMSLSEGQKTELIDGEVVTMPMARYRHERVKANSIRALSAWSLGNPLGLVFSEAGFQPGGVTLTADQYGAC